MTMRNLVRCFLIAVAFAVFAARASAQTVNIVHPLPPQSPAWIDGFQVRWPIRVLGHASQLPSKTVLVSLPTGGWLKPDASDLVVQSANGKLLPAAVLSHHPFGETIVQFFRDGDENWYWIYGMRTAGAVVGPVVDPKKDATFHEGITMECREWKGDALDAWPKVREGLEKSPIVLANGIVSDVVQNTNPGRPDVPENFAVSYRGAMKIEKEGTYRFILNGDGATFLFINGFKVFERPGANRPVGGGKVSELDKVAGKVDLKPGVHYFEAFQAAGPNPQYQGTLALAWSPPGQTKFAFFPHTSIVPAMTARTAAAEFRPANPGVFFTCGLDDTFDVAGLKLFLMRFEAQGAIGDPEKLIWDMGDGTQRKGRSVVHCWFKEADLDVAVRGGSMPPFRRKFRVWAEPGSLSPYSLEDAVIALGEMDWKKLDVDRVRQIFSFLVSCEQPNRWPLLDKVASHLLEQKDLDLEAKSQLIVGRMEALANLGKATEALTLADQSMKDFAKVAPLAVRLQMAVAAIHQYRFKDYAASSKIYKKILDDNSRVEHPNLRLAAVRWGDLFAENGDLLRADETYRLAATLGGEKATGGGTTDASARGALLRIAEQKLKAGEIVATRQLLQKLELEFPGRRLDGLYCFLKAESDRLSGRYEEAMRSYEMIFKLPQWAGYKDRATFGIADAYFRMGNLGESKKWFAVLQDAFPKQFEEKKGGDLVKLIDRRLERTEKDKRPPVAEMRFAIEPDDPPWIQMTYFNVVRAPSMQGEHCLITPQPFVPATVDWFGKAENLVPGGTYQVDVWYRDLLYVPPPAPHQISFVTFNLIKEGEAGDGVGATGHIHRNVPHAWHKTSMKLKVPMDQDFRFRFRINNVWGSMILDRLTIRLVGDRREDSLIEFLEGGKP